MKKPGPVDAFASIFPRKGETAPAPAEGYLGVTDLEGRLNRRKRQVPLDAEERRHSDHPPAAEPREPAPPPTPPSHGEYSLPLSSLIHRRRPHGAAHAPERAPRPAPPPPEPSTPASAEARPPHVDQGPALAPPVRRGKRRKLTVRIEQRHYKRIREIAQDTGGTYQDILSTAITRYLKGQE
jgi:hypothetical protein